MADLTLTVVEMRRAPSSRREQPGVLLTLASIGLVLALVYVGLVLA